MSAAISITETDFVVLALAAKQAARSGDQEMAQKLDKLARMANAALTRNGNRDFMRVIGMPTSAPLRWQDMPSTLED